MKKITLVLALLAAFSANSVLAGNEIVDCFYEVNVGHPACKK